MYVEVTHAATRGVVDIELTGTTVAVADEHTINLPSTFVDFCRANHGGYATLRLAAVTVSAEATPVLGTATDPDSSFSGLLFKDAMTDTLDRSHAITMPFRVPDGGALYFRFAGAAELASGTARFIMKAGL